MRKNTRLTKVFFGAFVFPLPQLFKSGRTWVADNHRAPRQPRPANERGFSLLELAVVMVISGLALQMLLAGLKPYFAERQRLVTEERLTTVENTLAAYKAKHGHYPCPAAAAPAGAALFGVAGNCADTSIAAGDCDQGACVRNGRVIDHDNDPVTAAQPMRIREGFLPVRDLGLADSFAYDPYYQLFRYAVAEGLASSKAGYDALHKFGGIEVVDEKGASKLAPDNGSGQFIVLSHGSTGAGAYNYTSGQLLRPCLAARADGDNCNPAAPFYRAAQRSLGTETAAAQTAYFDDTIRFKSLAAPAAPVAVAVSSFVSNSGDCPAGYDVGYSGRKPAILATTQAYNGMISTPQVLYTPDICIPSSALRVKGGKYADTGGAAMANYTALPSHTGLSCTNSVGTTASRTCLGLGNTCALCIPSTN